MQFGIKSLLGAMVLLAAFVMGVFQFGENVCLVTLLFAHALSPAVWLSAFCVSTNLNSKALFLGGIVTGLAPWIATFVLLIFALRSSNEFSVVFQRHFCHLRRSVEYLDRSVQSCRCFTR
jgi:hypothetical protein